MRPFIPIISVALGQPNEVITHVTDGEIEAHSEEVAFLKATQLISNGARSKSQVSWFPAPYLFNSRDRYGRKPCQTLTCPTHVAEGHVNSSLLSSGPKPFAQ